MKVFVFYAFEGVPYSDEHPMRGASLANEFLQNGHEVYYIASSFSHLHKKFRSANPTPENLHVILLDTKAYRSNLSIDRAVNHQRLSISLSNWLKKIESDPLPDLVIGASPPLAPNYILVRFCKKYNIPFVYDLKDLWPEEFLKFSPLKRPLKLFLRPLFRMAEKIVALSTAVTAVSSDYLEYYKKEVGKKPARVFHLGTYASKFVKVTDNEASRKIIMIGNAQFAPYVLMAAISIQNIPHAELTICGLNEKTPSFERLILRHKLERVSFIKWLDMNEIEKNLYEYAAGLIWINSNSKIAFPNRAFTYFAAGLPVINTIRGGELEKCISDNNLGISINFGDENQMRDAIKYCLNNFPVHEHQRIQEYARTHFDRNEIYKQYYNWTIEIVNKHKENSN